MVMRTRLFSCRSQFSVTIRYTSRSQNNFTYVDGVNFTFGGK